MYIPFSFLEKCSQFFCSPFMVVEGGVFAAVGTLIKDGGAIGTLIVDGGTTGT